MNLAVKYPITLSVSEPNNNIGLLKVRQADEESQTLVVQILEDAVPKSYKDLQVFFCARIGQTAGLGIIEQKLNPEEMTDPKNGKLEYTLRAEDWQVLGRQNAYFSFRKMTDDHTFVQQFSTRDFTYEVTKSIYSDGIKEVKKDGSTYVWTIEDLKRLYEEYIATGKTSWEEFVEQNKEIIENIDPGGKVLTELIAARNGKPNLKTRIDDLENETNAQLAQKATVLQYSQLGSISALKQALIEEKTVDIDVDITLEEQIVLRNCGIYSSNNSKITFGIGGQIWFDYNSFSRIEQFDVSNGVSLSDAVFLIKKSTNSIYENNINIKIDSFTLDLKYSGANAFLLECEGEGFGFYGVSINRYTILSANKVFNIKLHDEKSWINSNNFNDGVVSNPTNLIFTEVLNNVNFLPEMCSWNSFENIEVQAGETTLELVHDVGDNSYDLNVWDLHTTLLKDINKDRLGVPSGQLKINSEESYKISKLQELNEVSSWYRIGAFRRSFKTAYLKMSFFHRNEGELGSVFTRFGDGIFTSDNTPLTNYFTNDDLLNTLDFRSILVGDFVYVYVKSSMTQLRYTIKETNYFTQNYTPLYFTESEFENVNYLSSNKIIDGSFFETFGISKSTTSNGVKAIKYNDGTMIQYTTPTILNGFTSLAGATTTLSTNVVPFVYPFIETPHVSISGLITKSDGVFTGIALKVLNQNTLQFGHPAFVNTSSWTLTEIRNLSYYAIGKWK